jgi:phosphoribosylglycinamide formyltransferase-1
MNLGFFASHNGSNMQAVINACNNGILNANPVIVISNNGDAGAVERAKEEKVPYYVFNSKTHPSPDDLDNAMLHALLQHEVELIILAGYMKKIGEKILKHYKGRIINIHPALLPKYGGKGMYGSRVHDAVLKSGENETGVTIHIIDEEYDTGPIIAQTAISVVDDDTVESLSKRVLEREHSFLVETIGKVVSGEIDLEGLTPS